MKYVLVCLFAIHATLMSPMAWAATCSVSTGTGQLGSLSSFDVASTATVTQSSTGFKCAAGNASSGSGTNMIDATFSTNSHALGTIPRLFNAETGAYLPYAICGDAACGKTYNLDSTVKWQADTVANLLSLFTATGGALPLYIRPETGVQLPKGTYTDTITMNWSWSVCSQALLGLCSTYENKTGTSVINLTLDVLSDCFIDDAPDLSFGSAALVSAFDAVTQSIRVRCTPLTPYIVAFDMGNNAAGGWRRMLSGVNALQYNLYIPDTSTVWNAANTVSATGDGGAQQILYRAVIDAAQRNVPAGTYVDNVRVIVSY